MSSILPTWPHVLFGVLEPISLIAGWLAPIFNLEGFIAGQTPHAEPPPATAPSTIALTYQLANVYLLAMMVGVGVVYGTSEPKVLRNYIIALAIADVGHLYATYLGMGWHSFTDIASWTDVAWGNIAATGFLLINRVLYLMGLFGHAEPPTKAPAASDRQKTA